MSNWSFLQLSCNQNDIVSVFDDWLDLFLSFLILFKERLESLVFGLLRQKKLDFLDIYSEEMIVAAKTIVTQVRLLQMI